MTERWRFKPASHFLAAAREFEKHRAAIRRRLPDTDVRHVGGTALSGALTRGDLDILVRVRRSRFSQAVSELARLYEARLPDTWSEEFATFVAPASALPEDTGVSVAVIGSRYDRNGAELWDRLAAKPDLLEAYNALKMKHSGGDQQQYEEAKSAFFAEVLRDPEDQLQ